MHDFLPDPATAGHGATSPPKEAPILFSWSSGKDSTWALHELRRQGCNVRALVTSVNGENGRVAMHGVRRELAEAQARSLGLPLHRIELPSPCSNEEYEQRMGLAFEEIRREYDGLSGIAFGDLYLRDVRAYREKQARDAGLEPWFPLFGLDTRKLAEAMIDSGLRAILTCVDSKACPASWAGRSFDHELLAEMPDSVDPCGENGEFHTFVYDGPGFASPVTVDVGEVVEQELFVYADVLPTGSLEE